MEAVKYSVKDIESKQETRVSYDFIILRIPNSAHIYSYMVEPFTLFSYEVLSNHIINIRIIHNSYLIYLQLSVTIP